MICCGDGVRIHSSIPQRFVEHLLCARRSSVTGGSVMCKARQESLIGERQFLTMAQVNVSSAPC